MGDVGKKGPRLESDSDSDDDVPLKQRQLQAKEKPNGAGEGEMALSRPRSAALRHNIPGTGEIRVATACLHRCIGVDPPPWAPRPAPSGARAPPPPPRHEANIPPPSLSPAAPAAAQPAVKKDEAPAPKAAAAAAAKPAAAPAPAAALPAGASAKKPPAKKEEESSSGSYETDSESGSDESSSGSYETDSESGSAESSSDDDVPLAEKRKQGSAAKAPPAKKARKDESSSEEDDSSSEDDIPLKMRQQQKKAEAKRKAAEARRREKGDSAKRKRSEGGESKAKRRQSAVKKEDQEPKWQSQLEHWGVMFPPEYVPHGVKMLYDGVPVELAPEAEEVATMYAQMRDTDYMNKPTFIKNFWEDFKAVLGKDHTIRDLKKCDFTPIYEHLMREREKKKEMTKEEKLKLKEEKEAAEEKFKFATIDGRREKIGNFRVEPPGLFRGRGEHPKMGCLKRRVYPRDVTLNLSEGAPVPPPPYPGQTWKEVVHNPFVTWLAFWKDPINPKQFKYVFLSAESEWKGQSDLEKYEKARKLKDHIERIRASYTADFKSKDRKLQQMAVATYLIDRLALRAGHEKDEDEADTVGCCTLRCENIEPEDDNHVRIEFLGKDSMKYENTTPVLPEVYELMCSWKAFNEQGNPCDPGDQLFDCFSATDLNDHLKNFMPGLSAKVFRTYNASLTLDRLLHEAETKGEVAPAATVPVKNQEYNRANKEVAILCNHQRSVPKGHQGSMDKLNEKIAAAKADLKGLRKELVLAKKGEAPEGKKKASDPSQVQNKIKKKEQQIEKLEKQAEVKEDLKTVALGTSKINYMDPRITVAWCKRNEMPIEKVFNKSLINKFHWCMDTDPDFRF